MKEPIKDALEHWNDLHDMEYNLEEALHKYDVVASFVTKENDYKYSKVIMNKIKNVLKKLDDVNTDLSKLILYEKQFIKKFGSPDDRAKELRNNMFSI